MTGFNSKREAAADKLQEPVREALKLALITLEGWDNHDKWVWPETALEQAKRNTKEAITAIKEALAQPAQEPVAYVTGMSFGRFIVEPLNPAMVLPVGMALYSSLQGNT